MALPDGLARADGMTGVIIFAVVYAIVSILAKAKEAARKQSGGQADAEALQQQARQQRRLEERKRQLQQRQQQRQQQIPPRSSRPVSPAPGNTQAEGARLQDLLRVLTEAAGVPTPEGGPLGRRSSTSLPSDEDVEERESLEVEERIQNLESTERRPERKEVDFDDEAEAIVQRRIKAAQDRDRSLSRQDHAAFDQKIRAVPDATRVTRPKLASLRQAIVWREILGPPISLRKPSDPEF